MMNTDISVKIGTLVLENPFYVASGPTTKSLKQLRRIEETGWAAAVTKLCVEPAPYINREPRYGIFADRNALAFTAEKRLTSEEGLRLISDGKRELSRLKLIANITYAGDKGAEGWADMAKRFQEAGADAIELNMCCPNMSYNLELTTGGKQCAPKRTGASMGQDEAVAAEIVRAVKKAIDIPLLVKLTPEGGRIAKVSKALYEAGADAVGSTGNRMGMPPININDPGRAFYRLQNEISMSCHCGAWLKPLAQRDTYEIRKLCGDKAFITATGGVTNWRDAVEMILCGGNFIGVCAETLINGYDIVRPMLEGLKSYMKEYGYARLSDFRSKVVEEVKTATDVTLSKGYAKIKEPNLSAPCKAACPLNVPVQAFVRKLAKGDVSGAYGILNELGPLQRLCAYVCPGLCQEACVRGRASGRPVEIKELKKFVFESFGPEEASPSPLAGKNNGRKLAVIGSGPAGLACAARLREKGYEVVVFEKENELGGCLRYGIPDFRFDKKHLEHELESLRGAGVDFRTGVEYGKDIDAEKLKARGFEAAAIASGTPCAGGGVKDFMKRVSNGLINSVYGPVAVYGKSFISIDAARTAARLGAKDVFFAFDRLEGPKGHISRQLKEAEEEGVKLISDAELIKAGDEQLQLRNRAGIEYIVKAKVINELEDMSTLTSGEVQEAGFIFLCGKVVLTGGIASAAAQGLKTAEAIDRRLSGGDDDSKSKNRPVSVGVDAVLERVGYIKKDTPAISLLKASGGERVKSSDAFSRTFTAREAEAEAGRCLSCGCGEGCRICENICPEFAPFIQGSDKLCIDKNACAACGICFSRCPNGNIEMVET